MNATMLLNSLRAQFKKDLSIALSYRFRILMVSMGVLLVVMAFSFLDRMVGDMQLPSLQRYGGRYFPFVVVGLCLSTYMSTGLFSIAQQFRDAQLTGTLEVILSSRTPLWNIALGSLLYPMLAASLRVLVIIAGATLIFDFPLTHLSLGSSTVALIAALAAFVPFGIVSATVVILFKIGDPSARAMATASYLLGGVYYPVSVMPLGMQRLAQVLPITHALKALRPTMLNNATLPEIRGSLLILMAFAIVGGTLSLLLFTWAVRRVRHSGTLNEY